MKSIIIDEKFAEETVIMTSEPLVNISIEEMQQIILSITSAQQLVEVYANVYNKFFFIEDEVYDYEKGTEEYERVCFVVDAWEKMLDELDVQIMKTATDEGLLAEKHQNYGTAKQIECFMDKYGYCNCSGWWIKK